MSTLNGPLLKLILTVAHTGPRKRATQLLVRLVDPIGSTGRPPATDQGLGLKVDGLQQGPQTGPSKNIAGI